MPLSLHAAYVPSALQMLGTARHLVDTAEKWCGEHGHAEADLITSCLHDDMLPFSYQVKSVAEHTKGSMEALRAGVAPPVSLAGTHERALEFVELDELRSYAVSGEDDPAPAKN